MIAAIIHWWKTAPAYTNEFERHLPNNVTQKELDAWRELQNKHQGNRFTRVTMRLLGWSVVAFILFLIYRVLT